MKHGQDSQNQFAYFYFIIHLISTTVYMLKILVLYKKNCIMFLKKLYWIEISLKQGKISYYFAR